MTATYEIRLDARHVIELRREKCLVGLLSDEEADRLMERHGEVIRDLRKGQLMDTAAVAPTKKPRKPRIKGLDVFKKKFGMLATGELIELRDYLVAQLSKQREILRSELEAMEK